MRVRLGEVGELLVGCGAIAGGTATARLLEGPGERSAALGAVLYGLIAVVSIDYVVRRWRGLVGAGRIEF